MTGFSKDDDSAPITGTSSVFGSLTAPRFADVNGHPVRNRENTSAEVLLPQSELDIAHRSDFHDLNNGVGPGDDEGGAETLAADHSERVRHLNQEGETSKEDG
jgi:hypothetical protein